MPIAIQMNEYGPPAVLKPTEVPIPIPGKGEVVIKMLASAVNRADCEIRSGKWTIQIPKPFPYTPGLETCGTVHSVGAGVRVSTGVPVITMMQKLGGIHGIRPGGYQEYVKVPADTLAVIGEKVDPVILASIGLAGVTAFNGVSKLAIEPGHRVLVMGASGGVGSMAVTIAKSRGARVIAPTNRPELIQELRQLEVDETWDLSSNDWNHYAKEKVDAIFEMVGGETFRHCVGLLKPGGRLCTIGALTGGEGAISIWDLLHNLTIMGWSSEDMTQLDLQRAIDELSSLLLSGRINAPPTQFYPLREAAKAHEDMEAGRARGRLVLLPGNAS